MKVAYNNVSKSPNPFFCPQCRLDKQELELNLLKSTIKELSEDMTSLKDRVVSTESSISSSVIPAQECQPTYSNVVLKNSQKSIAAKFRT